jgi:hypothetical protein
VALRRRLEAVSFCTVDRIDGNENSLNTSLALSDVTCVELGPERRETVIQHFDCNSNNIDLRTEVSR